MCFYPKDTTDRDDQGIEDAETGELATCIFIDSHDHLEVSLTPHIMTAIYSLVSEYIEKPVEPQAIVSSAAHTTQAIVLINEIGPNSKVTVSAQQEVCGIINYLDEILISGHSFQYQ